MGSPKLNVPLRIIRFIGDVKMQLEDDSFYKFVEGKPAAWKPDDKVSIKPESAQRDGAIGKSFGAVLFTATNTKGGKPEAVTLSKSDNAPDQPSEVKTFKSPADVEFGKKYLVEDVDSNSNIRVGSRKFILNTLSVKGKVDNLDWQEGDTVVFSKGVTKNEYNMNVERVKRKDGKDSKQEGNSILGYYFSKD